MNPSESLKLLDDATATIVTDRKTHAAIAEAIQVLAEAIQVKEQEVQADESGN
jgi:hypothetical protein